MTGSRTGWIDSNHLFCPIPASRPLIQSKVSRNPDICDLEMPLHFSPKSEQPYFVTRFVGEIDDGQLFEYYGHVYSRPELQPMKAELADLSEADMRRVTTSGLEELAKSIEKMFAKLGIESIKTAVYSPDDLPFGLGRVYQAWSDSSPELVKVFRDRSKAIEWLCG